MRPTADIVNALVTRLTAATWTPPGEDAVAEPLFAEVKRFTSEKVADAFQQLRVVSQRVCLVVFTDAAYPAAGEGPGQVARGRVLRLGLILSDRVLGNTDQAAFGGATNPGVVRMVDLAAEAAAGALFPSPEAVDCAPISADFGLTEKELGERQPGRMFAILQVECSDRVAGLMPDRDPDDDP